MRGWIEENKSWNQMDGTPCDPHTNPELFRFRPSTRLMLIDWTVRLNATQYAKLH